MAAEGVSASIISSELVDSKGKDAYTLYTVEVRSGEHMWRLGKRYSHFAALNKKLGKQVNKAHLPPFPKKTWTISKARSPDVVVERLQLLDRFVQEIVKSPSTRNLWDVKSFFEISPNADRGDPAPNSGGGPSSDGEDLWKVEDDGTGSRGRAQSFKGDPTSATARVVSTEKSEGSKPYTVYIIEVSCSGNKWRLSKRFSQFRSFHGWLKRTFGKTLSDDLPGLPKPPSWKSKDAQTPEIIAQRTDAIDMLIRFILDEPSLFELFEVRSFFEIANNSQLAEGRAPIATEDDNPFNGLPSDEDD